MVSARSRKSLSAENIVTKTRADTLLGGPSDVLSESGGGDDYVYSESYSDFELKLQGK
jgi:hypothetical protein